MHTYTLSELTAGDEHIFVQKYAPQSDIELHRHDFIELIYILNGTGIQTVDGTNYSVRRGDMLFVNYGQTHFVHNINGLCYVEVMFKPEYLCGHVLNADNAFDLLAMTAFGDINAEPVHFSGKQCRTVEVMLDDMFDEQKNRADNFEEVMNCCLEAVITKMLRKTIGVSNEQKSDALEEICNYIRDNLDKDISLETLARRSFYNPSYFSRIFKERFSIGVKAYIIKLRVDKAARLLRETAMPVEKIAGECGFSGKTAFYAAFEKEYGVAPSQYRKDKS